MNIWTPHMYTMLPTVLCIHWRIHWRRHWNFDRVYTFYLHLRSSAGTVVAAAAMFVWVLCVRFALSHRCQRAATKILVTYMQLGFGFGFDAIRSNGSAIDRANAMLSVSSWSWVSWEQCRARSTIQQIFFRPIFLNANELECVFYESCVCLTFHWILIELVSDHSEQKQQQPIFTIIYSFCRVFLILFTTFTTKTGKKILWKKNIQITRETVQATERYNKRKRKNKRNKRQLHRIQIYGFQLK